MWSVGQKIGDYELLAHLRDGGMASLFLARRLGAAGFTRDVAIKIVHPELASDAQFRAMFLDEALLSARIQHPNVGHVEELGEVDGTHFLVMEFVHGCSLAQLQRALIEKGRRLAPAFAVRIAMHVAAGLHAAHEICDEQGRRLDVVHRDVSPENILLAYAGHVKLIDFGIAKAYGRRHRTEDGLLKGKFRYMSPEQASGQPIDRRTDVYQLGIVLWEMLTLRRLFDAETDVELLNQVRAPKVVPPSQLVGRISPALEAVVMSALDPNPARRPPDAQTFARRLGKAAPAAHEVDNGSLSSLLLALMQEQRRQQKKTYPSGLYDQLEQQIPTQRAEGASGDPKGPVFRQYTLEHTSPYGSDTPEPPPPGMGRRRRQETTEPAYAGAGHDRAREQASGPQPAQRERRLVRLASGIWDTWQELGTSITQLTSFKSTAAKAVVMMGVGALSVALLLVGGAFLLRQVRSRAPVALPALPVPAVPVVEAPSAAPTPSTAKALARDSAPLVLTPIRTLPESDTQTRSGDAKSVEAPEVRGKAHGFERPPAEQARPPHREGERKATQGRLALPVVIDGTPLIPEPGF